MPDAVARGRWSRLRAGPAVGEVALEIPPAAKLGGGVGGVVAEVGQGVDPLVPEAAGRGEAFGVVGAEVGVEAEEGTEGGGLVVAEVGEGDVAVEVSGEDLGVDVCAEAGQGKAVGAAREAELAGQEQVADAFAERGASAYADQPAGGEA